MTDFKKAMFEKRIEKLDELKPISITWKGQSVQIDNFEKINQLMSQAVEDDLKMYKKYLVDGIICVQKPHKLNN